MIINGVAKVYEYEYEGKKYGSYIVRLMGGGTKVFVRNGDSVGMVTHNIGDHATKCVSIIQDDVLDEFMQLI